MTKVEREIQGILGNLSQEEIRELEEDEERKNMVTTKSKATVVKKNVNGRDVVENSSTFLETATVIACPPGGLKERMKKSAETGEEAKPKRKTKKAKEKE